MRRRKEGRRCHQDEPLTHFENYFLPTTKVQTESPFLSPRDYRVSGSRIRNALSNCLKLPSLVRNSRMRPNSSCLGDHRNHERETTFIDSSLLLQLFTRLTREHGRLAFIVQVLLCKQLWFWRSITAVWFIYLRLRYGATVIFWKPGLGWREEWSVTFGLSKNNCSGKTKINK